MASTVWAGWGVGLVIGLAYICSTWGLSVLASSAHSMQMPSRCILCWHLVRIAKQVYVVVGVVLVLCRPSASLSTAHEAANAFAIQSAQGQRLFPAHRCFTCACVLSVSIGAASAACTQSCIHLMSTHLGVLRGHYRLGACDVTPWYTCCNPRVLSG